MIGRGSYQSRRSEEHNGLAVVRVPSDLQRTIQEAAVNNGPWHKPVTVKADGACNNLTVTTTVQAAQILLNRWPTRRGKALEKAKVICVQVIEGTNKPEKARKAFVKAARKAGLWHRSA